MASGKKIHKTMKQNGRISSLLKTILSHVIKQIYPDRRGCCENDPPRQSNNIHHVSRVLFPFAVCVNITKIIPVINDLMSRFDYKFH